MRICFGSPSVTWLRLGSMWCLWPFLTLTEGCCDQLCGRLSVSHWGLVFKWQAWRWCQDCYAQYVQKYQKNVTWILLLSPGWDVFNSNVSFSEVGSPAAPLCTFLTLSMQTTIEITQIFHHSDREIGLGAGRNLFTLGCSVYHSRSTSPCSLSSPMCGLDCCHLQFCRPVQKLAHFIWLDKWSLGEWMCVWVNGVCVSCDRLGLWGVFLPLTQSLLGSSNNLSRQQLFLYLFIK